MKHIIKKLFCCCYSNPNESKLENSRISHKTKFSSCNDIESIYEEPFINIDVSSEITRSSSNNINSTNAKLQLNFEWNHSCSKIDPHAEFLMNKLIQNELSDELFIDSSFYREEEKGHIEFSIRSTIELYLKLINRDSLEILYEKENDNLFAKWSKEGWELNKEFFLSFHKFSLDISDINGENDIDITAIKNIIYNPDILTLWDKDILKSQTIDSSIKDNVYSSVFQRVFNNPIPFSSNRERVDKQIVFDIENRIFALTTSCNENSNIPVTKGVERMINYLSLFSFFITYKDNKAVTIEFCSFNQIDAKMSIPDFILNFTIPMQTKSWYNKVKKAISIYKKKGYEGLIEESKSKVKMEELIFI